MSYNEACESPAFKQWLVTTLEPMYVPSHPCHFDEEAQMRTGISGASPLGSEIS